VHGNNDTPELKRRFPERQDICIEGHRLVLIHGDVGGRTALAAARGLQEGDIVLFGHSHRPFLAEEAGRILLNPGSPTDRRWGPYCSFATVEVGETIEARIVRLP
jgi:putative phosphoesterase